MQVLFWYCSSQLYTSTKIVNQTLYYKWEEKKPKDPNALPEGLTKKELYDIVKEKMDEHGLTGALAKQEKRAKEAE